MKKTKLYEIIGALLEHNETELVEAFQIIHLSPMQRLKKKTQRSQKISQERVKDRRRYNKRKSRGGPIDLKISRAVKRIAKQRKPPSK